LESKFEIHCRLPICAFLGLGFKLRDDLKHAIWNPGMKYRLPICGFPGLGFEIRDDLRHGIWNPSLKYTAGCQSVVSQVLNLKSGII